VVHTGNYCFTERELPKIKAAGVPVYLGRIDYKGKYCEVGPLFYPTEDVDADLAYIMSTYHDANPKYPENFSNGN